MGRSCPNDPTQGAEHQADRVRSSRGNAIRPMSAHLAAASSMAVPLVARNRSRHPTWGVNLPPSRPGRSSSRLTRLTLRPRVDDPPGRRVRPRENGRRWSLYDQGLAISPADLGPASENGRKWLLYDQESTISPANRGRHARTQARRVQIGRHDRGAGAHFTDRMATQQRLRGVVGRAPGVGAAPRCRGNAGRRIPIPRDC